MAAIGRTRRATNIWPGFVDALATLLLVLIFILSVFVLAQFFLNEAISGRDAALQRLENQVSELAELLGLERKANIDLRLNVKQLSEELQASVALKDDLQAQVQSMTLRAEGAEQKVASLNVKLADAFKTIETDRAKIEVQIQELAKLTQDVAALQALREELEKEVAEISGKVRSAEAKVVEERKISESARAQVALLNRQMAAFREQLAQLNQALEASERLSDDQKVQIAALGKRLNAALASKVQELSRYRSEFFGRLREVLGSVQGVRIVGDRFVFQSEVLFGTGSADIGAGGQHQLAQLARTLGEISSSIPVEIDWILRVDGHTDRVPIKTAQYPSNWELSTARAISVVRFLVQEGIPANRLAATGFAENQPLDPRDDEIAYRRNRRIELKLTQR